ncbi:MAG TPA: hypothetical protein PKH39_18595 [Woeseiaceae bacterium]|nr:hypothetical protein [Woeseiaceae bacterium]
MKWRSKQPEPPHGGLDWLVLSVITIGPQGLNLGSSLIARKSRKTLLAISLGSRRLFAVVARANFHQEFRLRVLIMSEEIVDPFVRHALKSLLDPTSHFSICRFDEICKLLNVIPPPGHRDRLSLMHCTKYRDMPLDLRQELGRLVYESLNTAGFDIRIEHERLLGKSNVKAITGKTIGTQEQGNVTKRTVRWGFGLIAITGDGPSPYAVWLMLWVGCIKGGLTIIELLI